MRYFFRTLSFIALVLLITACSSQEDKQQKRQKEISEYVDALNINPTLLDQKKADTLIAMYGNYVKDFPQDTMCEFYLFQMSNVYQAMNKCDSALYCLDRIIKEYPYGNKVGAAYFFKGVVLKDVCLNTQESVKAFETYIEKFPQSKHAETARRMIMLDTMQNELKYIENSVRDDKDTVN
ncbi:MAG: tetratricopeptide repeat protein [Bacteroidales bacterium]|nr:tetratricopeptide repeat protein [Bacteroidales bacterium]